MKWSFLFFLLLCYGIATNAQNWEWATSGQGIDFDNVDRIAVDEDGNTYVLGSFFDVLTIDTFHLVSHGVKDIFWAKFDKYGQVVWAKSTGGKGEDNDFTGLGGIAVDKNKNVYVFLSFSDTISSGGLQVSDTGSWNDLLLAKYDSNGNLLTYKSWSTPYAETANSIAIDKNCNIYIYGTFAGYNGVNPPPSASRTLNFDTNNAVLSQSTYGSDLFIAKLDTNLAVLWAKTAEGSTVANQISVDADTNIVITGLSAYNMKFDNVQVAAPYLFVWTAKYNSTGTALWVNTGASNFPGKYWVKSVSSLSGSVYCAGTYDTPNNINPVSQIKFGNTTLTGDYAFLVKYDANGNLQWAKNLGQTARDAAFDIAADSMDNLYVTGTFNYTGIFGNDTLYTVGHDDIFVNKYDSNGNHIWTVTAGGITNDGAYAIALDKNNDIHIGGYISSDPAYFGSYEASSAGAWDMCVAKLHQYPTGVPELSSFKNTVHVYPNPNFGSFLLDYGDKQYEKMSITDISGREIYHEHIDAATKQQINLNLSDGVYFIHLTGKGKNAVQKFIVQH